ncbi:unknown [Acholeplasma sp. CAG:878]|nr:unknown [Acholeplasma sp. CAG:878]
MKKLAILLLVLLLSGCTVVRIDTSDLNNIVDVVLSKDNTLFNQVGKGYKYYIPVGVSYIDTEDFNDILYSNGNYYYLYIDTISYYYNVGKEYVLNNDAYYSRSININGKYGYLEINKQDDLYFVEFMYNFSKIEALVKEEALEEVILNASYILSTVKFNNNVITMMLDDEFLVLEEKYDIFTSKKETNDFLKLEESEEQ